MQVMSPLFCWICYFWLAIQVASALDCKAGYKCSEGGETLCPNGMYSAASASSCLTIEPGSYCASNNSDGGCMAISGCEAGYQCSSGVRTVCANAMYALAGSDACTLIPDGSYCNATNLEDGCESIAACQAGYACSAGVRAACIGEGPTPEFTDSANQTACTPIPLGFYCSDHIGDPAACIAAQACASMNGCNIVSCSSSGDSTCQQCSQSYYLSDSNCHDCPAGYECSQNMKTVCPSGTYSAAHASSCTTIQMGSYCLSYNTDHGCTAISACQAGYACSAGVRAACIGEGPTPEFTDSASQTACTPISLGFYCSDHIGDPAACIAAQVRGAVVGLALVVLLSVVGLAILYRRNLAKYCRRNRRPKYMALSRDSS